MDENTWSSTSEKEKEPFLLNHPMSQKDPQRKLIYMGMIWLVGHVLLFAILGSVLIVTIKNAILNASSFEKHVGVVSLTDVRKFGGLPVQYDDLRGPYVTCETAGSPSAALKAGCGFDLFFNGWTPAPCFDAEKHEYFINKHDYFFWRDEEKRHRVPQATILEGKLEHLELYVSFEEHYEHCRYLLNTTKRYAHNPTLGVLDMHLNEEHMNHCIDFLAESRDRYNLEEDVVAIFGYRKCFLPRL